MVLIVLRLFQRYTPHRALSKNQVAHSCRLLAKHRDDLEGAFFFGKAVEVSSAIEHVVDNLYRVYGNQ